MDFLYCLSGTIFHGQEGRVVQTTVVSLNALCRHWQASIFYKRKWRAGWTSLSEKHQKSVPLFHTNLTGILFDTWDISLLLNVLSELAQSPPHTYQIDKKSMITFSGLPHLTWTVSEPCPEEKSAIFHKSSTRSTRTLTFPIVLLLCSMYKTFCCVLKRGKR